MTIGVIYFQSRSCPARNLAKLHIIQISSTCFRPKPCMSRCMLYNIAKIKYFNKIYVFVSRSLSISFNFTFISIHAGLPYRHVFAATHRDIRLYSSVFFNWNLYNKKWKKRAVNRWLKIWQNGLTSSVSLKGHFFSRMRPLEKRELLVLSEQYHTWHKFLGQLDFYSESGVSLFTFSVIYSALLVNGSTNCHVRRIMKSISRRAATMPNNWRSLMIT